MPKTLTGTTPQQGDPGPDERLTADRLTADRLTADRLTAERLTAERLTAERLTADRLAELRDRVDAGTALDVATDVPLLRDEMARASAATAPAAAVLAAAADERAELQGDDLSYPELELLWRNDPALAAVKRLYDRERACWRRANGILAEHEMLVHGEDVEIDRRAPYRLGSPASPPARRRLAGLSRWAR